jgi:hypothetical protein
MHSFIPLSLPLPCQVTLLNLKLPDAALVSQAMQDTPEVGVYGRVRAECGLCMWRVRAGCTRIGRRVRWSVQPTQTDVNSPSVEGM